MKIGKAIIWVVLRRLIFLTSPPEPGFDPRIALGCALGDVTKSLVYLI